MNELLRRSILYLSFPVAVGMLYLAVFIDIRTNPERKARAELCGALATDVLKGASTRLDYMATRCPARLLTSQETE